MGENGLSKRQSNWYHFRDRLLERAGYRDPGETHKSIIRQIQEGESKFIEKASKRRTLHLVDVGSLSMVAVYDKVRKQVVTVRYPSDEEMVLAEENKARQQRYKEELLNGGQE